MSLYGEGRMGFVKFSKKSRYGLAALIDLAENSANEHISLASIAERNEISSLYLEQVFAGLKRGGIVKSVKGPQGGYKLSKAPKDILISDVILALEGSYHLAEEEETEKPINRCIQGVVVDAVNEALDNVLQHITLQTLLDEYEKIVTPADMYFI